MKTSNQSVKSTLNAFPYKSEGVFYEAMYNEVANSRYLSNFDDQDKHDVIMGILERAWTRRHSFNPEKGKLTTWMNRVIFSYTCDKFKSAKRFENVSGDDWESYESDSTDSYQRKEKQLTALEKEISGLNQADQKLMKLYEEGRSGREIAAALGITETNVRARISRIKTKLRAMESVIICYESCCKRSSRSRYAKDDEHMVYLSEKVCTLYMDKGDRKKTSKVKTRQVANF